MGISTVEKVIFLKSIPFFQEMSGEELISVTAVVEEVRFKKGEDFIRQGDIGDCLYIIVEGEVGIAVNGKSLDTTFRSKDVIGELAVLAEQPRAGTCSALSDVLALKINKDDFWKLLREKPVISFGVIKILLNIIRNNTP